MTRLFLPTEPNATVKGWELDDARCLRAVGHDGKVSVVEHSFTVKDEEACITGGVIVEVEG